MIERTRNLRGRILILLLFAAVISTISATAYANDAQLTLAPDKTPLTPALLKTPVMFKGSGFAGAEMVVVDLVIPAGMTIKGVDPGEQSVGLAYATADGEGNFETGMKPTATLNWFFQVGWTKNMKPDLKQAKPLPPGKYEITATGMDSGKIATATLEILPPPQKK